MTQTTTQSPARPARRQRTLYGYTNYRYFCSDPSGVTYWFLTKGERNAFHADHVAAARRDGLSDPEGAFKRVRFTAPKGCGEARQARFDRIVELIKDSRDYVRESNSDPIG